MAETVAITSLGHSGDGIAESDGGRVFVPYTLPGETVEIEREDGDHGRAQLLRIVTPSADRVAPESSTSRNGPLALMYTGTQTRPMRSRVVGAT